MNKLLYYKSYEAHMKVYDEMRELDYKNQIRQLNDVKIARQMELMGLTQSDINDRLLHIKKNKELQNINAKDAQKNAEIVKASNLQEVTNVLNDLIKKIEVNSNKPLSIDTTSKNEVLEEKPSPTESLQSIRTNATSSGSPQSNIEEKQIRANSVRGAIQKTLVNDKKLLKNFDNAFSRGRGTIYDMERWAFDNKVNFKNEIYQYNDKYKPKYSKLKDLYFS